VNRTQQVADGLLWFNSEKKDGSWKHLAFSPEAIDFIIESLVIRSRFSNEVRAMECALDLKRDIEDIVDET
jgi:hypothetical protein